MRIGVVLSAVPRYSETFFVNKIRGLQSQGHEVVLFVNTATKQKTFENATVISAPKLSGNPIKVFLNGIFGFLLILIFHLKTVSKFYHLDQHDRLSFLSIVKRLLINNHILSEKLDWLHFGFGTMALGRENVAQAIGAKMAVSFRGFDHYVYPVKNPNCYKILFNKRVKYHVLSEGMKSSLIQSGIFEDSIVKITPAIDTNMFAGKGIENPDLTLKIITVARLHWIKGLEYVLEALVLIKQKGIDFHYTIVGDGPEKERLQFAVVQLGLKDNVTFDGKLKPLEVRNKLEQSDLYLQYSIQEGFCNAVLEAQAMGKICVVSDAEGLMENVMDGVTGYVVPKRNPVLLAEKICEISGTTDYRKLDVAKKAVERIKEKFTAEKQTKDFTTFYTHL